MDETVLLRIGRVVKTHGVTGDILVAPDAEDPNRLLEVDQVHLGKTVDSVVPHSVIDARIHIVKKHTGIVFRLKDIDSVDEARALQDLNVYASLDALPELGDDEYFLDDLVGYKIFDSGDNLVGTVHEVTEYPSQTMLEVKRTNGTSILIPLVVPDIVVSVDSENAAMVLADWEGLIDD